LSFVARAAGMPPDTGRQDARRYRDHDCAVSASTFGTQNLKFAQWFCPTKLPLSIVDNDKQPFRGKKTNGLTVTDTTTAPALNCHYAPM
jgi:hypothetical protein